MLAPAQYQIKEGAPSTLPTHWKTPVQEEGHASGRYGTFSSSFMRRRHIPCRRNVNLVPISGISATSAPYTLRHRKACTAHEDLSTTSEPCQASAIPSAVSGSSGAGQGACKASPFGCTLGSSIPDAGHRDCVFALAQEEGVEVAAVPSGSPARRAKGKEAPQWTNSH